VQLGLTHQRGANGVDSPGRIGGWFEGRGLSTSRVSPPGPLSHLTGGGAAVTQVWDILKKGVEDQVDKASPVLKFLFQTAFSARAAAIGQGRESPLLKLIFKKVLSPYSDGKVANRDIRVWHFVIENGY
jgi:hypothetical protein